jgi:hypothetical protein
MSKQGSGAGRLRLLGAGAAAVGVATISAMVALPAGAATDSWGAYWVTTPVNGLVSQSDTFVVPTLNCAGNAGQLGERFGVIDNDQSVQAVVQAECNATTPSYQFIVSAGSTSFTESGVGAGDTVVASWFQTPSLAQAVVHDVNHNVTWVADGAAPGTNDSAVYGEFPVFPSGGGPQLHIAPFGTVTFTKCQVNGDYLGYSAGLEQFSLHEGDVAGNNITTGAIMANKDSFRLTFKAS